MKRSKFDEYRAKDHRVKCALCNRFMRYSPTEKTPARRRHPPHAGTCTECPIIRFDGDTMVLVHEELTFN